MKKATIEALYNYINGATLTNLDEIKTELEVELNRGKTQKETNQVIYDEIWGAITQALEDTPNPVTAQELADETGFPKGKIVYGLSHYWQDRIIKTEGKVNSYTLRV